MAPVWEPPAGSAPTSATSAASGLSSPRARCWRPPSQRAESESRSTSCQAATPDCQDQSKPSDPSAPSSPTGGETAARPESALGSLPPAIDGVPPLLVADTPEPAVVVSPRPAPPRRRVWAKAQPPQPPQPPTGTVGSIPAPDAAQPQASVAPSEVASQPLAPCHSAEASMTQGQPPCSSKDASVAPSQPPCSSKDASVAQSPPPCASKDASVAPSQPPCSSKASVAPSQPPCSSKDASVAPSQPPCSSKGASTTRSQPPCLSNDGHAALDSVAAADAPPEAIGEAQFGGNERRPLSSGGDSPKSSSTISWSISNGDQDDAAKRQSSLDRLIDDDGALDKELPDECTEGCSADVAPPPPALSTASLRSRERQLAESGASRSSGSSEGGASQATASLLGDKVASIDLKDIKTAGSNDQPATSKWCARAITSASPRDESPLGNSGGGAPRGGPPAEGGSRWDASSSHAVNKFRVAQRAIFDDSTARSVTAVYQPIDTETSEAPSPPWSASAVVFIDALKSSKHKSFYFSVVGVLMVFLCTACLAWRIGGSDMESELQRTAAVSGKGATHAEPDRKANDIQEFDCGDSAPLTAHMFNTTAVVMDPSGDEAGGGAQTFHIEERSTLVLDKSSGWSGYKRLWCCKNKRIGCEDMARDCQVNSSDCNITITNSTATVESPPMASQPNRTHSHALLATTTATASDIDMDDLEMAGSFGGLSHKPSSACAARCSMGDGGNGTCLASIRWVMKNVYTPGPGLPPRESCKMAVIYVAKMCASCAQCMSDDAGCNAEEHALQSSGDSQASSSLFCFVLFMPNSDEESLLKAQLRGGRGVFECDSYKLYSNVSKTLDEGEDKTAEVSVVQTSLDAEYGQVTLDDGSHFMTAFNTEIFINLWAKVVSDGRYMDFDWSVKVDADTVFLPERLRAVVSSGAFPDANEGAGVFLSNCRLGLHGPIEVLSQRALQMWAKQHGECEKPPEEDVYLQKCLVKLGAKQQDQFDVLAEKECHRGDWAQNPDWEKCTTGEAAFHPFKDSQAWQDCYARADNRVPNEKATLAHAGVNVAAVNKRSHAAEDEDLLVS